MTGLAARTIARLLLACLGLTMTLAPCRAAAQQDCSHPPKVGGDKWWKAYASWCTACGGSWDADKSRCTPGPNWGRTGDSSADAEATATWDEQADEARLRQEADIRRQEEEEERRRLEEDRQRAEAEATKRREAEFERRKADALRDMKPIGAGELGLKDLGSKQAAGLEDLSQDDRGLGLMELGSSPRSTDGGRDAARREQDEFDRMNAAWLKRQQESIREAVAGDRRWTNEVLASITSIRVPSPVFAPKSLADVRPGDILLVSPDDSLAARAIVRADPLYRAIDYFSLGNVSAPDFREGRASHALTAVKAVGGEILFLDHTGNGSRILTRQGYLERYGRRMMYVARPQAVVNGRQLWEAARQAALQKKSDYGLTGERVVCSERAGIAVAKATGLPLQDERHRLGGYLGPVDITPSDFFDREHVGKYFLISATPIVPAPSTR